MDAREGFFDLLSRLGDSPVFHFSLGSKELFHSNFLAWIFEQPEWAAATTEFFGRFVPQGYVFDPGRPNAVFREKQNIDVWLTFQDKGALADESLWHVWIENKVKSLPRRDQLEAYAAKKPENATCVLLSLSEMDEVPPQWETLSFEDIHSFIKKCTHETTSEYHRNILQDYALLVNALVEIEKRSNIQDTELFDFWLPSNPILRALDAYRLDDFYLKKKYAGLANLVWHAANTAGFRLAPDRSKIDWKLREPTVFVNSGMTRATGFMDIKYVIRPHLSIGIQIQGNQYRLVVEDNTGRQTAQYAKTLLDAHLWFQFPEEFGAGELYPKRKLFNRFGPVFLYQSKKIPPTLPWNELIQICLRDLQKIEDKREIILQLAPLGHEV